MLQTSVEIVKPGGTGSPALVISARPEPLPPRRPFMLRLPAALPPPKKNTRLRCLASGRRELGLVFRFAGAFCAIVTSAPAPRPGCPSAPGASLALHRTPHAARL